MSIRNLIFALVMMLVIGSIQSAKACGNAFFGVRTVAVPVVPVGNAFSLTEVRGPFGGTQFRQIQAGGGAFNLTEVGGRRGFLGLRRGHRFEQIQSGAGGARITRIR